jgi:hypothetical protein
MSLLRSRRKPARRSESTAATRNNRKRDFFRRLAAMSSRWCKRLSIQNQVVGIRSARQQFGMALSETEQSNVSELQWRSRLSARRSRPKLRHDNRGRLRIGRNLRLVRMGD